MKNWMCPKCQTVIQNSSRPNPLGCPSGSTHPWVELGNVGAENYQCKKCGVLVRSTGRPNPYGCANNGSHQWNKL